MLFEITIFYKNGFIEKYLTSERKIFNLKEENIQSIGSKRFKYSYHSNFLPPVIVNFNGVKKCPGINQELHPNTTLQDIEWIKPLTRNKEEKVIPKTWEFKSSSSDIIYKVIMNMNKLKCDCPGFWRVKGQCKHVKEVQKELQKN